MADISLEVWGISAETSKDAFDDWDVLETLYDLSEGDGTRVVGLMRAIFGKEQAKRIVGEIRAAKGDARATTVNAWLMEAFDAIAKKSMGEPKN